MSMHTHTCVVCTYAWRYNKDFIITPRCIHICMCVFTIIYL